MITLVVYIRESFLGGPSGEESTSEPQKVRYDWVTEHTYVQSLSRGWLFATPWTVGHQAPLSV